MRAFTIRIGRDSCLHEFRVVRDCEDDALIGLDLTRKLRLSLDYTDGVPRIDCGR